MPTLKEILAAKKAAAAAQAPGTTQPPVTPQSQEATSTTTTSHSQPHQPEVKAQPTNTAPAVEHPLSMKVAELGQLLEAANPGYSLLLRDIHASLKNDPELVTVLSDEEIGQIMKGLLSHTDTTIAATSKSKSGGKRTQPVTADMF